MASKNEKEDLDTRATDFKKKAGISRKSASWDSEPSRIKKWKLKNKVKEEEEKVKGAIVEVEKDFLDLEKGLGTDVEEAQEEIRKDLRSIKKAGATAVHATKKASKSLKNKTEKGEVRLKDSFKKDLVHLEEEMKDIEENVSKRARNLGKNAKRTLHELDEKELRTLRKGRNAFSGKARAVEEEVVKAKDRIRGRATEVERVLGEEIESIEKSLTKRRVRASMEQATTRRIRSASKDKLISNLKKKGK